MKKVLHIISILGMIIMPLYGILRGGLLKGLPGLILILIPFCVFALLYRLTLSKEKQNQTKKNTSSINMTASGIVISPEEQHSEQNNN